MAQILRPQSLRNTHPWNKEESGRRPLRSVPSLQILVVPSEPLVSAWQRSCVWSQPSARRHSAVALSVCTPGSCYPASTTTSCDSGPGAASVHRCGAACPCVLERGEGLLHGWVSPDPAMPWPPCPLPLCRRARVVTPFSPACLSVVLGTCLVSTTGR